MEIPENFNKILDSRGLKPLIVMAAVSTSVLAILSAFSYYKNNVWKPKVHINSIDFQNQIADITIGRHKDLKVIGDSTYHIGFDWGVRFGYSYSNGKRIFDRLELVKNNVVYSTVRRQQGA